MNSNTHTWSSWTPEQVAEKLKQGEQLTIVDVREPNEWFLGHIPVAKHIPLQQIPARLSELDPYSSNNFRVPKWRQKQNRMRIPSQHGL